MGEAESQVGRYKVLFEELSCVQGILRRGDQVIVSKKLQADVVAFAHEGHLGVSGMLRQLRESV